jgi:hypothetical protein
MTSNRKSLRATVLTVAAVVAPAVTTICLAPAAYANASGDIPIVFHDQGGQVDRITDLVEADASSDSTPVPSEAVDAEITNLTQETITATAGSNSVDIRAGETKTLPMPATGERMRLSPLFFIF